MLWGLLGFCLTPTIDGILHDPENPHAIPPFSLIIPLGVVFVSGIIGGIAGYRKYKTQDDN